jgi:hypothetical protein
MKNQEIGIYSWDGELKKWKTKLLVEDELVFTGQFDTYVEAVKAVQEVASGKPRAILTTQSKQL